MVRNQRRKKSKRVSVTSQIFPVSYTSLGGAQHWVGYFADEMELNLQKRGENV